MYSQMEFRIGKPGSIVSNLFHYMEGQKWKWRFDMEEKRVM